MVKRAGAVIVDAGGSIVDPTTLGGELVYTIQTLMASVERKVILERTMAGKRRLAAEGKLASGSPPWGRTWDSSVGWGVEPKVVSLYRRLFDLILRGRTLRQVATQLNDEEIPTPRGRAWTPGSVYNLVRAPHAAGAWRSLGSTIAIPPIVDAATQAAAIAKLKANDIASGKHDPTDALLRKIGVCGTCGEPLYTDRRMRKEGIYTVYYCRGRQECSRDHRVTEVDEKVQEQLAAFVLRPGALAAAAGVDRSSMREEAENALREARAQLRDLDKQEERLARLGRRGKLSARVVGGQAAEIGALRERAQRAADDASASLEGEERLVGGAAEVEARIAALREGVSSAGFPEWRALVRLIFPRGSARVWPDGRIELRGAFPLDSVGEKALQGASASRDLSPASRGR
jgi:hypothetical protein